MDRIKPPSQHSMIISNGCHYAARVNSEIGIYGVFIRYVAMCRAITIDVMLIIQYFQ